MGVLDRAEYYADLALNLAHAHERDGSRAVLDLLAEVKRLTTALTERDAQVAALASLLDAMIRNPVIAGMSARIRDHARKNGREDPYTMAEAALSNLPAAAAELARLADLGREVEALYPEYFGPDTPPEDYFTCRRYGLHVANLVRAARPEEETPAPEPPADPESAYFAGVNAGLDAAGHEEHIECDRALWLIADALGLRGVTAEEVAAEVERQLGQMEKGGGKP